MDIDLDLYRHEVRVSTNSRGHGPASLVRLSAIDISPEHPKRTFVFIHGFGGQAAQWHYQMQKFSLENRVIALDLCHSFSIVPGKSLLLPDDFAGLNIQTTPSGVSNMLVEAFGGKPVSGDDDYQGLNQGCARDFR